MSDRNVLTKEIFADKPVTSTEACAPDYCKEWSRNRIPYFTGKTIKKVQSSLKTSQNVSFVSFKLAYHESSSVGIARDNVIEALLRRLSEHESVLQLKSIADITEDVENYLSNNSLMSEILTDLVGTIQEQLREAYNFYKTKIFFSYDKEVPNWNELVLSFALPEKNIEGRFKLHETLGKVTEKLINKWRVRQTNNTQIKLLEEFDRKLSLEVKILTDV